MNSKSRKEPYYNVKIEGDYSNWSLAGFPGMGERHDDIKSSCECSESCGVTVQTTTVKNISDTDLRLTHVSSALINGIGEYHDDYVVHICSSTWQGEMQWNEFGLSELGVYEASNHVNVSAAKISFNGSQTTSEYYPLIMIENKRLNEIWFFEIEPASGWYFEIGVMENMLYVEMNSACFFNDGWSLNLKPCEEYTSSKAYFGKTEGGFSNAVAVMNNFKRRNTISSLNTLPVVFNDYMNCLWAKPNRERLLPLIDSASDAGCEIFCIDDGWYGKGWGGDSLGDWYPNDKLFAPLGFKGIVDYINNKGMIAGVWLEIESCAQKSEVYTKLNKCLLRRNGIIIGGNRAFLDFRCDEVRSYTMELIDRLYENGVRYIKNDYNHNICVGCDGADSFSQGLAEHRAAVLEFIDSVKYKYPDMIIESCSSGAMRADFGFTKHMDLQSISDHEIYYNNPSIIAGTFSYMPPEKCGIWGYPYPLMYDDQPTAEEWSKINIECDREEVVFNLVNSMLGVMYLSGHIEMSSDDNMSLIKEAISVYKKYRSEISDSEPVYLEKPLKIYEKGVMALGLKTSIGMITAVWKIDSADNEVCINIPAEIGTQAELMYPCTMDTEYSLDNGILSVNLDKPYAARLFLIK